MAFYNRVKKLPAYQVMRSRKGSYLADVEFNAIGSHKRPTRIMERVEIDHTQLDLILLDDDLLVPLGRPCLTLLIDSYSHCVVGFNLSFNQPGYESVRNALLSCIPQRTMLKKNTRASSTNGHAMANQRPWLLITGLSSGVTVWSSLVWNWGSIFNTTRSENHGSSR